MSSANQRVAAGQEWRRFRPTIGTGGQATSSIAPRLIPKRGRILIGILKKAISALCFSNQRRTVASSTVCPSPAVG